GLQVLLLRENGYACDGGVLYYRETRQRVPLPMTPELEAWIHGQIVAARETAAGPIPAPLVHSRKCPRCSLVSICLPDETAYLDEFRAAKAPQVTQLGLDGLLEDQPVELASEAARAQAEILPDRLNWGPFAALPEIRLQPPKPPDDVRRLIAPNEETKALYLNTPRHWVSKSGDNLVIKEDGSKVAEFRIHDIHHLGIFGPVQLSTQVVQVLCERDVPITWFTLGGWFYGMTRGHSLKNVFTRIEQFRHAADPDLALPFARLMIYGKIRNQRTLLMRNHLNPDKGALKAMKCLAASALHATSGGQLFGIEGSAALLYFANFSGMLKTADAVEAEPTLKAQPEFTFYFDKRNRRPPRDPVNALLSLLYSLLAKDCTIACYAVGFDPYVGFLHQPRFGRPALALDLMEEFRPLIADSTALSLINNRMVTPDDFLWAGTSVNIHPKARKQVFIAYEKRLAATVTHPVFGYKVSYRRALELQARLLAKCLTGEIEQYIPFTTR
ncbi:MAG: CRISPR-associated endonuclease Cas1, partial [Opitutales bacterium]